MNYVSKFPKNMDRVLSLLKPKELKKDIKCLRCLKLYVKDRFHHI